MASVTMKTTVSGCPADFEHAMGPSRKCEIVETIHDDGRIVRVSPPCENPVVNRGPFVLADVRRARIERGWTVVSESR